MPLEEYRRRIKDEKRSAILRAAFDAFLNHGYDCTTLQQIAKAAGLSTATLFSHFPTKAALFGEIMEFFWEADPGHEKPAPQPGDPEEGLFAIGRDYARLLGRPRTAPLFRIIIAEAPRFPELGKALFERGKRPYINRLHEYLSAETATGTLSVDDIPLAARQFMGMINDLVFWPGLLLSDFRVSESEVERVIRGAVATFMARYGKRKAANIPLAAHN